VIIKIPKDIGIFILLAVSRGERILIVVDLLG
jgi:hypothetical protein